jgi:hypothetical protein
MRQRVLLAVICISQESIVIFLGGCQAVQDDLGFVRLPVRSDVESSSGRQVGYAEDGFETVGDAIDLELIWIITNGAVDGAVFQFVE